ERLAKPGTTYISEDTFKLTEGFFRVEGLGEKKIKGKKEPVKVFRVLATSTRITRFDVSAERGLTPFEGREHELELLLNGFKWSKAGRGQAFSITSEAGIGKSRLLYEFRKVVANEYVTFMEGKCLSYSRSVPYRPLIDIVKSSFDIGEDDGDFEIRKKVKSGLKILKVDEAETLPYLLELLSIKNSGIDKILMSPEAKKERIIEALKQITIKASEIRPLIIAIEDLHWIDKSSEDSLKDLLDSILDARIFLIFTYRPEHEPIWGPKPYHRQITLKRLSPKECLSMMTHLLGTERIDKALEDLVLEKTEGVPFFIEEFIKSLKDLKIIKRDNNKYYLAKDVQAVAIPSTIQDIIMARVDSLPARAKEVLHTGSVIEREFSYELIKLVVETPEKELRSSLSILKDSELIYERGRYDETTYIFKHALTREVVYDSILTQRKKKFHEKISQAIEEYYKEVIEDYYGILAEHYIASENYEKGAEYSRLACKKAEKAVSLTDAIAHCKKRIACIEKLSQTDEVQKNLINARTVLGLYYTQINYHVESKAAVEPVFDLALRHGDRRMLAKIYTIIGAYDYMVAENFPKAFEYLEKALKISEEENDIVSLFFANHFSGIALSLNCEFEKALCCFEKALDINVASNTPWGISAMKCMISYFVYYLQGMVNLSYQTSNEAMEIAEVSDDIYSKAMAYTSYGISCCGKGYFEKAIKHLLKGVDFCERINLFFWNTLAQSNLAETYFELGEYQKSKNHYSNVVRLVENKSVTPYWGNLNKLGIAKAQMMNDELIIDLESLNTYEKKNTAKIFEGWIPRYIGKILLSIDDHHMNEAEDWINKAIDANKRNGMMLHLGRDYILYSELFDRKGEPSRAKENLNSALEIFTECGVEKMNFSL
ncbi:AAA family ATPase, partial [Thermodesulfobacteriota bacterium]